jgi:serine/threonine protein kinase
MHETPPDSLRPFQQTTSKEISEADKDFILRIMKLDPRDRPTAASLLEDVWFKNV